MLVDDLPLDKQYIDVLKARGIRELYPPQEEAVKRGLLDGKNMVIAAPTAAGKTLMAELAMVRTYTGGMKTLYLSPLRAVASEKHAEFSAAWEPIGLRIALSIGDYDSSDPYLSRYDTIITTYEKADSLLRHHAPWLGDVGLVVVDEIHYIDDEKRGPVLETLISLLRDTLPDAQILGLSATIGNLEDLAEWLDAVPLSSGWRPVPLREGVYHEGVIRYADGSRRRIPRKYQDPLANLVHDTLAREGQVLIFTSSRRRTVSLASRLARVTEQFTSNERASEIASRMRAESESRIMGKQLSELILKGISFHHAGLSYAERRIVEEAFRRGVIKAVVATPTLGAGVNLPARMVVIEDYTRYEAGMGRVPIKVMEYKQFAGRAGRPGYDEAGEAILVARRTREVEELLEGYVRASPEPVYSKLGSARALRSQVLAAIASHGLRSVEELVKVFSGTLYASQYGVSPLKGRVLAVLDYLSASGFIVKGERLAATSIGVRVSELYIDPLSADVMLDGLKRKQEAGVLGYLHLVAMTPDMPKLRVRRSERSVLEGILDKYYEELLLAPEDMEIYDYEDYMEYISAFKTALMLSDWINELDVDGIMKRYGLGPGDVRAYTETARWLVYSASELARLAAPMHVEPLRRLHLRVAHGVKEELLELVRIPGIGRVRARRLYEAGIRSIDDLRRADPSRILSITGIGRETLRKIMEYLGG